MTHYWFDLHSQYFEEKKQLYFMNLYICLQPDEIWRHKLIFFFLLQYPPQSISPHSTHTHIHTQARTTHIQMQTCTHIQTRPHTHIGTCVCTCTHNTHMYTHRLYEYTHTLSCALGGKSTRSKEDKDFAGFLI